MHLMEACRHIPSTQCDQIGRFFAFWAAFWTPWQLCLVNSSQIFWYLWCKKQLTNDCYICFLLLVNSNKSSYIPSTLRFFQSKFKLQCEKEENKQKEAGVGPYFKSKILQSCLNSTTAICTKDIKSLLHQKNVFTSPN